MYHVLSYKLFKILLNEDILYVQQPLVRKQHSIIAIIYYYYYLMLLLSLCLKRSKTCFAQKMRTKCDEDPSINRKKIF